MAGGSAGAQHVVAEVDGVDLVYVFGRPVMDAVLASFAVGMFVIPFVFTEPLRRLVSYGESLIADTEMRDWLTRLKYTAGDKTPDAPYN